MLSSTINGGVEAVLVLHFPDGTDPDAARMVMGDAAELVENHWDVAVSMAPRGPGPNAEREQLHSALEGALGVLLERQTSGERWRTAVEKAKAALNG